MKKLVLLAIIAISLNACKKAEPIDSTTQSVMLKVEAITVQGGVNSGLDIRPPQPPCAFFVQGNRYQINDVKAADPGNTEGSG